MNNPERVGLVEITEAMEGRFENMHYKIVCDTCGAEVSTAVLSADFHRPVLVGSYRTELMRHNITHLTLHEIGELDEGFIERWKDDVQRHYDRMVAGLSHDRGATLAQGLSALIAERHAEANS